MIPSLCIAHKPPLLSAKLYDAIIDTPPREDYQTHVSVVAHPSIALLVPDGPVNICGYRKIMVRKSVCVDSHRTINVGQARGIGREQTEPMPGHEFLICMHNFVKLGGKGDIKVQWGMAHHMVDFIDAFDLTQEMGILTLQERVALEREPALVEGGCSMGVFPGRLIKDIFAKTIPFYREFAKRHQGRFKNYDPVQRRCIAFLAERLETHFILKEIRARYGGEIPPDIVGCLTAVSDGPWAAGTMP